MSILSTSASLNGVMRWRDGNKGGNHMPSVTRHILGNSLKRFEASSCPRRRLASDRIFSSDDVRHSMRMIFSYCGFCNSVSTRATLNDEAKTILRGWQIAQMEAGGCSPWVFPSDRGDTHVNPTNFYHRVWMPSVKRAGIAWCTWHELRHTFASRLAMSGKSEGTIASLLRHSTTTLETLRASQPILSQRRDRSGVVVRQGRDPASARTRWSGVRMFVHRGANRDSNRKRGDEYHPRKAEVID